MLYEELATNYQSDVIDFRTQTEGFARELERVQILFRQLQQEFTVGLENYRQTQEEIMRAAGLQDN